MRIRREWTGARGASMVLLTREPWLRIRKPGETEYIDYAPHDFERQLGDDVLYALASATAEACAKFFGMSEVTAGQN